MTEEEKKIRDELIELKIKYKKLSNRDINTIVLYNQYKEFYRFQIFLLLV